MLEEEPTDTDRKDNHSTDGDCSEETVANFVTPSSMKFFSGNVFHTVSNDEPTIEGENEDSQQARRGRNAERTQRRTQANPGDHSEEDHMTRHRRNRRPCHHGRYQSCKDGQPVSHNIATNLANAWNYLSKAEQTLEINKAKKVIETAEAGYHEGPPPSYTGPSTSWRQCSETPNFVYQQAEEILTSSLTSQMTCGTASGTGTLEAA